MNTVRSADGTAIAYDRLGDGGGPVLLLVCGALCDRGLMAPTADALSASFTVLNYDRRGRGDSGDTPPFAVEREIEDLAALIGEGGGRPFMYGHSSGAALALRAAAAGLDIERLVLHDPPYGTGAEDERRAARRYGEQLTELLRDGRRGDAAELFMTTVGMPPEAIAAARAGSSWPRWEVMAPTLAYDSAVMGDVTSGGVVPESEMRAVSCPTLVVTGGADHPWMIEVGRRMAEMLPAGRHHVLEGHEHVVPPEVLAPVLADFLAR